MKAVALASLVLALLLLAPPAYGTPAADAPSSSSTQAAPAGASAAPVAAAPASGVEDLISKTLGLDISTASYYELLAWCRRVGLSDAGTKSDLQARLRAFYKLAASAQTTPDQSKTTRTITIQSADSTEYFTVEKVDQNYIRLSGKVVLTMTDPQSSTTHTILADTILFNQTMKTITASGHLQYYLTGKGKTEVFRGESLTFNVDSWEGLFFNGTSESEKQVGGNNLTFYFTGKTIDRSSKDVISLTTGTITSSADPDPNYRIDASRIWVLAPGEWALENAVLYVGRIPLFYIPAFFHPGDEIVFNPSFGYRQEEGYYLQTTTYLVGRKPKNAASLSFLQIAEDTNETYNTELRGLFLRKTTAQSDTDTKKPPYDPDKTYLKIVGDVYSRLGQFGGIEGELAGYGLIKDSDIQLTAAHSRDIYIDPVSSFYTPFWGYPDGTFSSRWNTSNLGSQSLPIRFGANADITLQSPTFTLTGALPFYSDPYYLRDFQNRDESVDWSKVLGINQPQESLTFAQSTTPQILSTLLWSLHAEYNPDPGKLKPWITTAQIASFDLSAFWNSKALDPAGVPGLDPSLTATYINPTYASDFFFPEKEFFYPDTIILPNIAARIAGTLVGQAPAAPTTPQPASPGQTTPTGIPPTAPGANPPASQGSPAISSTQPAAQGGVGTQGAVQGPSGAAGPVAGPSQGASSATQPGGTSIPALPALPPWGLPSTENNETPSSGVRPPDIRADIPIVATVAPALFAQNLSYVVQPNFSIENHTVSDSWGSPANVSLNTLYSILNARGSGTLQYTGAVLGSTAAISNALVASGNYKIHFNENTAVPDWQTFLDQDYAATFFTVSNALILTSQPLDSMDFFRGTQVKYSLTTDLFTHEYVSGTTTPVYDDLFLPWDSTHVAAHSVGLTLSLLPGWNQRQTFTVNASLPPLPPEVDASGALSAGPLTTTATTSFAQASSGTPWQGKPLTLDGLLAPVPWASLEEQVIFDTTIPSWTQSVTKASLHTIDNQVSLQESFTYDLQNHLPLDSTTRLNLWFFNAQFEEEQTTPYTFTPNTGWTPAVSTSFVPASFTAGISYNYTSNPFWKNRVIFSTTVASAWNLNLLQFTQSSFDFQFTAKLSIFKFVDLAFSSESTNSATYLYIPGLPEQVGLQEISPITDLLRSFNFFNVNDRIDSNFKMKSISLNLVHHLEDWDITVQYSGSPQLVTSTTGASVYEWTPTFSIIVQWNAVPELKANPTYQNSVLSY